jgi:spermidine/putrescine transport system substrate-binding protein
MVAPFEQMQLNRRQLLAAMSSMLLIPALSACNSRSSDGSAERQLNILNWADYLHPDAIPEFERRYSCKVIYDTFASNEALMAKLQAGGSLYDVIVPSSYMVKQLNKLDILSPLDHSRLPGLAHLLPRFTNSAFDPGLQHCVPYTWGTTGIGFSLAKLTELGLLKNSSNLSLPWEVFWDKRLSQRMTLLDDGREVIGMSLKMAGHSYNTIEKPIIAAATAKLIEQKPLTMCYTSDQVIVELASGDSYLSQVFSGDAYQARRDNPDLRFELRSHTDCRGSYEYNDDLSAKRAKAATDYLVKKGVPRSIIVSKGYGERELLNECKDGVFCDEKKHEENRRTEFIVTGKK